jgi:alkylhydroperoxidase family enzyme
VLETLEDPEACPVSEGEREALRFAERMTREARAIEGPDIERLRAHFDDDQIVEMACVIGMFNYLNRFAEAMGLWPTGPGEGGPDDPEIAG